LQEGRTNSFITSSFFKKEFFAPPDRPEGIIVKPILRKTSVEPQDDKASYFTVGELLTTTSFNPSPMLMPAISRNDYDKSPKGFWRLK